MVPLRHGTSRVLLLITRYTPSLRLVPRRHFAFRVLLAHSLYTILENVETSSSTKPAETSVSPIRAGVHTRALRLIRIVTAAGSASSLRVLSTTCTFLVYLFSRTSTHPVPPHSRTPNFASPPSAISIGSADQRILASIPRSYTSNPPRAVACPPSHAIVTLPCLAAGYPMSTSRRLSTNLIACTPTHLRRAVPLHTQHSRYGFRSLLLRLLPPVQPSCADTRLDPRTQMRLLFLTR
jgi:hypothetical protein